LKSRRLEIIAATRRMSVMSTTFIVAIVIVQFITLATAQDDRVKVSVYYETHCPDSMSFIRYQLWPAYSDIASIMNIDLVPFGKANYVKRADDTITFRCQHGPRECYGNTIQACAIKQLNDIDVVLPFVYCMERENFPDRAGEKCSTQSNITWSDIRTCADGSEGQQHLMVAGDRTLGLSPKLRFVPRIEINDAYTQENQDTALDSLIRVVCENYRGNNIPSRCEPYVTTTQPGQGHTPNSNADTTEGAITT